MTAAAERKHLIRKTRMKAAAKGKRQIPPPKTKKTAAAKIAKA